MADSENSRTMPAITRRKVLSPPALAAPVGAPIAVDATASATPADDADPVLRLWMEWQEAHARYAELTAVRGEAEAQVLLQAERSKGIYTMAEDHSAPAPNLQNSPKIEAIAGSDCAAILVRWVEIDDETGYSRALMAERRAAERCSALARDLLCIPTRSISGVAAKLNCFIETNAPTGPARESQHPDLPGDVDPSFADLRAILTDLVMIRGTSSGLFRE